MKTKYEWKYKKEILAFFIICFMCCSSYTVKNKKLNYKVYISKFKTMDKPGCLKDPFLSPEDLDKKSKNLSRTPEVIKKTFIKTKPVIISFFKDRDSLFNNKDTLGIYFIIGYKGKIIPKRTDNILFDSLTIKDFNSILKSYYMDSIKDYSFNVKLYVKLQKKPSGLTYIIDDKIVYNQIRTKSSIMRTVMLNLAYLRYAYNRRLREKPGLRGRISVKFAINEKGKIIFSKIVSTNMHDIKLEKIVLEIIKTWEFCPVNNTKDIVEVVYPFVFDKSRK